MTTARWMQVPVMEQLRVDLLGAARGFRRTPGTALGAVALLALGIAGVTTLFAPLNAIVLRPLPFPDPDRLVVVGMPVLDGYTHSFPDRRTLAPVFSAIAAYRTMEATFSRTERPTAVAVAAVTQEFFATLGKSPTGGPDFADIPINQPVAVVSSQFWRNHLGAVQDLNQCSIRLGLERVRVVGVAPPGFDFPSGTQVWIPWLGPGGEGVRGDTVVVGRLRAGLAFSEAVVRMRTILSNPRPGTVRPGPQASDLQPLRSYLTGERQDLWWTLWTVSVLFLLLACAGVANLLWARGIRRRHEMSTRLALGASRARLVRQLLTEALALVVSGAAAGFGISALGIRVVGVILSDVPREGMALASSTSMALVLVVTVLVTILCGLAPALRATGNVLGAQLKAAGGNSASGRPSRWKVGGSELLAGSQMALALALLICTALLLRSLTARLGVPLGFEPRDVVVVDALIPEFAERLEAVRAFDERSRASSKTGLARAGDGFDVEAFKEFVGPAVARHEKRNALFYAGALDILDGRPEVVAWGMLLPTPFMEGGFRPLVIRQIDPKTGNRSESYTLVAGRSVGHEAFRALGIRLLAGRTFLPQDAVNSRLVFGRSRATLLDSVIVNQALARKFWPSQDALGKQFYYLWPRTVVGVVSDIRESPDVLGPRPTAYFPFDPTASTWRFAIRLRPGTPLTPFAADIQADLMRLIPALPAPKVRLLREQTDAPLRNLRLSLILLACFAGLGTVVGGLGVYATATETAAARTKEMGIRVALGASPGQIRRLAIWRSLRIALGALPAGVFAAWALARGLSHWLFQVGALDPVSVLASATILFLVAFFAGLRPALRAAGVDAATTLRCDG